MAWLSRLVLLVLGLCASLPAMAQLHVEASQTLAPVIEAVRPVFLTETGIALSVTYGASPVIRQRLAAGATFDVAMLTRDGIDRLADQRVVLPSTRVDLARSGLGIAVRAGAPLPDIFTTAALKRTLLQAPSIMRSANDTSGLYFEALITHLGIADAIHPKQKLRGFGRTADGVALGEATIAVQQISEILQVRGARLAGPLPPGLQLYTSYAAAVGTRAPNPQAAAALIARMADPSADLVYRYAGLLPPRLIRR